MLGAPIVACKAPAMDHDDHGVQPGHFFCIYQSPSVSSLISVIKTTLKMEILSKINK